MSLALLIVGIFAVLAGLLTILFGFTVREASLGSTLGRITSTLGSGVGNVNGVGGPRVLQAGAKLTF